MIIGIPKEIKNNENRVSITPAGVFSLAKRNVKIIVQKDAGAGSGFVDDEYINAGAEILPDIKSVYDSADLILKVKEPVECEYGLLHEGQSLFTYLHLAPNPELVDVLINKKITAVAYETVQKSDGTLPLLVPMSEVAGRMSIQIGAALLQKNNNGKGMLLGGVPGVKPANVLIIGGGTVGINAAKMACGLGAGVTVADIDKNRLIYIDEVFNSRIKTLLYNPYIIEKEIEDADLLIGAVLIAGKKAPKTVSEQMVKKMNPGSVIVDVAIDQGGSIETIDRVTTHDNPYYIKHDVIHYSVANMPGAVPRTSTIALTGVTLPYIEQIAQNGIVPAVLYNDELKKGLNTFKGCITLRAVAVSMEREYTDLKMLV